MRVTRVDTIRIQPQVGASSVAEDPRGWNCWRSGNDCVDPTKTVESQSEGQTLTNGGQTFGRVRYMRNGIITPTDPGTPIVTPPVVTPPVVTPPVVTPPTSGPIPPELPRGTVDTTMPVAPPGSVIIRVP